MPFNQIEMANGTKYRILVPFDDLVRKVDTALKEGGLLTLPTGITEPGNMGTVNPQQIVEVINGMY